MTDIHTEDRMQNVKNRLTITSFMWIPNNFYMYVGYGSGLKNCTKLATLTRFSTSKMCLPGWELIISFTALFIEPHLSSPWSRGANKSLSQRFRTKIKVKYIYKYIKKMLWIRIRTNFAVLNPDPGAWKLTKIDNLPFKRDFVHL